MSGWVDLYQAKWPASMPDDYFLDTERTRINPEAIPDILASLVARIEELELFVEKGKFSQEPNT